MIYTVYFSIFSRKMRVSTDAENAKGAIEQVKNAIIIHKVQREKEEVPDFLKDLMGAKGDWPF